MFLRQIIEAFFVRTEPDSSMVNPAHIHITSAPQMRKAKVLSANSVSPSTPAAAAMAGRPRKTAAAPTAVTARMVAGRPKEWSFATMLRPSPDTFESARGAYTNRSGARRKGRMRPTLPRTSDRGGSAPQAWGVG